MVLGKRPVPGRPTNMNYSRARTYCACSRCGLGLFEHFSLIYHFLFFLPFSGRRSDIDCKNCLKGSFSPKQTINQSTNQGLALSV